MAARTSPTLGNNKQRKRRAWYAPSPTMSRNTRPFHPRFACCRLTLHLEFNDSVSPLRVPPNFRTPRNAPLALSDLDRGLIDACLSGDQLAWKNLCDRFAGLILDVVNDSMNLAKQSGNPNQTQPGQIVASQSPSDSHQQSIFSKNPQTESLVEDFFRSLRSNQFQLLRDFRQKSSLASYLAVAARRHTLLALANQQRSKPNG